jgi:hypothetical protein
MADDVKATVLPLEAVKARALAAARDGCYKEHDGVTHVISPDFAKMVLPFLEAAEQPKDTPSETACGHRIVASRSGLYDSPCPYTKDHAVHTDPNISSYHEWTPRATVQALPAPNGQTDYIIERSINEWWTEKGRNVYGEGFENLDKLVLRDLRHKIMEHLNRG